MKVILQQDVKGHGKKGQMVDVSDGYARNFLLPRKLVAQARAETNGRASTQAKARQAHVAGERQAAMDLSNKLKECPVKIVAKAGQGGRLFGSVTTKEISEGLKQQYNIDINKSKLVLADPIKAFGGYEVKCKLGYEITGTVRVMVTEEA